MGEWQPIETVPPNILVIIWDGYDVCIAKIRGRDWVSYGCDGAAIQSQDDFGTSYQEPGIPTHWMPLPSPPIIDVTCDTPKVQDKQDQVVKAK